MATKLELTLKNLLKDKDNFISERGVEKKLKNGKTELLMSIKGLNQEVEEKKIEEKQSSKKIKLKAKTKEEVIVEEKPTEEE